MIISERRTSRDFQVSRRDLFIPPPIAMSTWKCRRVSSAVHDKLLLIDNFVSAYLNEMTMTDATVIWVILVGPVFGGRCGAEALGLGLGLSPGPAYRFALPPGLAAKTTRCLVFDQGRPTSHLHCRGSHTFDPFVFAFVWWILFPNFIHIMVLIEKKYIYIY